MPKLQNGSKGNSNPVSRARSSRQWGMINHGENSTPRDQASWRVSSANFICSHLVIWDHGRKNKDNVMISDMFLYLIMLNLLKESYALHAIQL